MGYKPENAEPGYIKYATEAGINFIFSSIPISDDDRIEGAVTMPKPHMDHLGIDMRDEADATRAAFDAIVHRAAELGWREVPQNDGVHCCHTQVKAKHWTYPPPTPLFNVRTDVVAALKGPPCSIVDLVSGTGGHLRAPRSAGRSRRRLAWTPATVVGEGVRLGCGRACARALLAKLRAIATQATA